MRLRPRKIRRLTDAISRDITQFIDRLALVRTMYSSQAGEEALPYEAMPCSVADMPACGDAWTRRREGGRRVLRKEEGVDKVAWHIIYIVSYNNSSNSKQRATSSNRKRPL
jgi:hypothetical protein